MGVWKQLAALPNPRSQAAACFHDAKLYLFGGQATTGAFALWQNTTYIYDPAGNTWSTGAALPTTGLCCAFSTAGDGVHVLFLATGAHYAYDPEANTWSSRTSAPGGGRVSARHFVDAAGLFYLAGGRLSGGATSVTVNRYDPATDSWTTRANMPSDIAARSSMFNPGELGSDSKVYLGNASTGTSTGGLTVYDPATDTWATTSNMPDAPNAIGVDVSRTPSGTVLALPHLRFSGTPGTSAQLFARVDGYDPATGAWTMGVTPDFPGSNYGFSAATEPGGLVFLVGGFVDDSSGIASTTSQAWSYKQNDPPTAPTARTLVGGVTVSTAVANRASWRFNDPNAGDSQSAFTFYYRPTGTTSWTTVTRTSPNTWYDFAAGSLDPVEYEWQVETYDAAGEISPRMTSAIFTAADPPDGPTITYPINGQIVEQNETIVFSAPALDAYELRRVADDAGVADTGTVYYDTGEVAEPLTRSLAVTFDVNDRFEHVQVRVKDGGLWSDWVDVLVEVSYTPPPAPTFTAYPDASTGSLLLMITTPAPEDEDQPAAAYVNVYINDGAGEEQKATELPTTTAWRFWTPVSGRDYAPFIRVESVAANGTTASSE